MTSRRTATPRSEFAARFAAWLRDARASAGLTAAELAKATRLAESSVWAYEAGTKVPSLEAAHLLAAALGRTLAEFGAKKNSRKNARS